MGQEMEHFAMPVTRQLTHQQSAPADDRQPMLPLIGRRDNYEPTYSAPLLPVPQRRLSIDQRTVISSAYVRNPFASADRQVQPTSSTSPGRHIFSNHDSSRP